MDSKVGCEGERFARFFPELEDVEIWVWQLSGGERFASEVRLLKKEDFPGGWDVGCSGRNCNGVLDPRGWVYALLHKGEDSLKVGERCKGVWQATAKEKSSWPCHLQWQLAIRLVRKEDEETQGV